MLLLEKEDFGWATSAWNSRLIHGGLKYLEKYDVALVRESLREREWLLHAAPHLVAPLRMVLPMYARNAHPAAVLRLGMVAYDALSWDKSTPRHRIHDPAGARRLVPGLDTDGLQGAATYYDCQVDYPERLVTEVALAARAAGAVVLNHARVDQVLVERGAVTGVMFTDTVTGTGWTAAAPTVVNAAGPWVDGVLGTLDGPPRPPLMGGTKGTHLVVDPFPGAPVDVALYYQAITDGRPMMVIPWLGRYLIGATDVRFDGDLDTASSDDDELDYILRETNLLLPRAGLTRDHVLWRYTGVRPLPYQASGPTGDITRRHIVHAHETDAQRPVRGLYSVIGGKLTTFRVLAEHVGDAVFGPPRRPRMRRRTPNRTRSARLPGAQARDFAAFAARFVERSPLPPAAATRLVELYGTRAAAIEALAVAEPALAAPVAAGCPVLAAEVAHAVRVEAAVTLADVVARRVMTGIDATMGRSSLDAVARVAAAELGWSAAETAQQTGDYLRYITKFHPAAPVVPTA